jgi:predicted NAD-dependent protein-ADP-ribosyltransferase YbiA (DUF1768 family)
MLPTTNQPIMATIDENFEDDNFEDDDFQDEGPQTTPPVQNIGFTFNPVSTGAPVTQAQQKFQVASLVTQHGNLKNADVKVRFIVGPGEKRKAPGKGVGEVDRFKRAWNKLQDFNANHNWRRIISNEFEGDYFDAAMPFTIDGVEWLSVYHYLLGMLYSRTPAYALLFSMNSKEDQNGFWSKVKAAKRQHDNNLTFGTYPIDMEFGSKIDTYLRQAWLAKFTQNPLARSALLLTEDAVLSIRGNDGVLDLPLLMEVREQIRANPTSIYRGPSVAVEHVEEELPVINSAEELNHGYVDRDNSDVDRTQLIAGTVTVDDLYRTTSMGEAVRDVSENFQARVGVLSNQQLDPEGELELLKLRSMIQIMGTANFLVTESIEVSECVIYLATGAYKIDVAKLIMDYGYPKFITRHLYAVEKVGYDANSQLLIGIQRTPVSQTAEYLVINTEIASNPKIPISIYLEPFVGGFGLFIIAATRDNQVLDFLRFLTQTSPAL